MRLVAVPTEGGKGVAAILPPRLACSEPLCGGRGCDNAPHAESGAWPAEYLGHARPRDAARHGPDVHAQARKFPPTQAAEVFLS